MRRINIGLTEEQRKGVCDLLNNDLADALTNHFVVDF